MPTRKTWDYAINLKEDFVPKKGRTYLMSRQEKGGSKRICGRTVKERLH